MKIDRKKEHFRPDYEGTLVTLKVTGNIAEVRYMRTPSHGCNIERIDADTYKNNRTGEVKLVQHKMHRAADKASVAQSLRKLRDLINTNLTDANTALWVTLTYAENMTDAKRLYEDFRRFWQRFQYYLQSKGHPHAEYITAAEPQGRGAWHLHALFLFPCKAPFIPNSKLACIWGKGFTKIKQLESIDNVGLYLTAYLGSMELTDAISVGHFERGQITEVTDGENGKKKSIIKGARLSLYPANFNLFRHSKGIKYPKVYQTTEEGAMAFVGDTPLSFEKTIVLVGEDGETKNIINYRQYNRAKKIQR